MRKPPKNVLMLPNICKEIELEDYGKYSNVLKLILKNWSLSEVIIWNELVFIPLYNNMALV